MNKKVNNIVLSLNQIKVSPGNISKNAQTILKAIFKAKSKKIDLLVFPEFSTTGYLIGDIWERNSFLEDNAYWVDKIIKSEPAGSAGWLASQHVHGQFISNPFLANL